MRSGPVLATDVPDDAGAVHVEPSGPGTVVVGHDGPGPADHALRRAAGLASQLGETLVVVRAYSLAGDAHGAYRAGTPGPSAAETARLASDALGRDVARVLGRHDGLSVVCRAVHATAVRALTAVADGASMLMLGSHSGGGSLHDDHPGSVSRRCVRDATCPVLLVGPEALRSHPMPVRDEASRWAPSAHLLEVLVTAGVLAPSMHNTQPWTFWTVGADLFVGLDGTRLLPAEDPASRAATLSIGAVVTNVRCRAAVDDVGTDVTWLPEPTDGRVAAARIHLEPGVDAGTELAGLATSIPARRTRRRPMSGRPVADSTVRDLTDAVGAEGAVLIRVVREGRDQLADLVAEADGLDGVDDLRQQERHQWTGGERARDGIPERSFGPQDRRGAVIRDFAPGVPSPVRGWAQFERQAPLFLLGTVRDDELSWLRAGAALERLWLVATSRGLAMSFLNQVLERDDLRLRTRTIAGDRIWPHMVVRLGYGEPPVATPRRPWQTFLV